ncbi:hypothetical protein B0H14DRAFT_3595373 [Mycena olivaceomarginata]|nr:hypothetical protein B0H14DRAFT_3595373 [Mycena olivaceomarginata]
MNTNRLSHPLSLILKTLVPTRTALTRTQAFCSGFLGVSDLFAAAFWGLDYALQMAHSNFSGTMFHLGGQDIPSLEMDPVISTGFVHP